MLFQKRSLTVLALEERKVDLLQSSHVLNILKGYKNIRVFGVVDYWHKMFKNEVMRFYKLALKDTLISTIPNHILELIAISSMSILVIYFMGSNNDLAGSMPIAGVFAFSIMKILPSVKNLGSTIRSILADLPNVEASYIALNEMKNYEIKKFPTQQIQLQSFNKQIRYENVSFNYDGSERKSFK